MPALTELPSRAWNRRAAAHLLLRTGFAPTQSEIDTAVRDGLDRTVERLFEPSATPDPSPAPAWTQQLANDPNPNQLTQQERMRFIAMQQARNQETKTWWLERMAFADRPAREKMTLFWSGHFTTEAKKIFNASHLLAQNDLLRTQAFGGLRSLLLGISRDPAMLRYLDNNQNRREHPNENYARELMELFSMGVGNYTEDDVKAAARAFTGWTFNPFPPNPGFRFAPFQHDDGEKTFLGKTGRFGGEEVIDIILEQPCTARFMAAKLCRFFMCEEPPRELVDELAAMLRGGGYQFRPVLTALLRAESFYDPARVGNQIKSPIQLCVGAWRQLRAELRQPRLIVILLKLMGQDPLDPPNVKGWDGGEAWINTVTLSIRQNLASVFLDGKSLGSPPGPGGNRILGAKAGDPLPPFLRPDVDLTLLCKDVSEKPSERSDHFIDLMLPTLSEADERARLTATYAQAEGSALDKTRALLTAIMQSAHYQLC